MSETGADSGTDPRAGTAAGAGQQRAAPGAGAGGSTGQQPDPRPWYDLQRLLEQLQGNSLVPVLIGGAALMALVVALFMWASSPSWRVLYSNLGEADGGRIISELEQMRVPFRLSEGGQAILVPGDQVHRLRLQLAEQGLPQGGSVGLELMEDQSFGISQFAEQVNYQRGMEGELSRSIESLGPVSRARIHLAMARQSVFVREREPAKASVVLTLHPGRTLSDGQVAAITHLVASSVPELNADHVTVVSQDGSLLSRQRSDEDALDGTQLSYARQLERVYQSRIQDILEPMFGDRNVRIQVAADMDFARREETSERFGPNQDPGSAAVRSAQRSTTYSGDDDVARGIPGALSNTPPGVASSPIELNPDADGEDAEGRSGPAANLRHNDVFNYEVDRNIMHIRHQTGLLERLSVAVVVNYRNGVDEDGEPVRVALSDDEMDQVNRLVRQAMGFSAQRGDQLEVINTPFADAFVATPEDPEWWQEPRNIELAISASRYLLVILLALLGYWLLLRPLLKRHVAVTAAPAVAATADGISVTVGGDDDEEEAPDEELSFSRGGSSAYDRNLKKMRELAQDDPHTVAMVVRKWINDDLR